MPPLQQYVLDPLFTGDYDEQTIAEICMVIETALSSLSDAERFKELVKRKMNERFDGVRTLVDVVRSRRDGKIIKFFISIMGVRGANMVEVGGSWRKITDGMKKENLKDDEKQKLLPYNRFFVGFAGPQGVRSLQDLAAYQVAESYGTNLEMLPIPKLLKKVVSKFNFEH
eukprot:GFUD01043291.1.p1 GENE.GFUD01043291.1~~GFUD01043291.1.p1  ORF type:complete len:170 (+),score=45.55 GFUD01043291.1:49-558(+)